MTNTSTEKCCWNDELFWRHLRTLAPANRPTRTLRPSFSQSALKLLVFPCVFCIADGAKGAQKGALKAL
jgi:hypothetical protein